MVLLEPPKLLFFAFQVVYDSLFNTDFSSDLQLLPSYWRQ